MTEATEKAPTPQPWRAWKRSGSRTMPSSVIPTRRRSSAGTAPSTGGAPPARQRRVLRRVAWLSDNGRWLIAPASEVQRVSRRYRDDSHSRDQVRDRHGRRRAH